jgi:hypothetical protein
VHGYQEEEILTILAQHIGLHGKTASDIDKTLQRYRIVSKDVGAGIS